MATIIPAAAVNSIGGWTVPGPGTFRADGPLYHNLTNGYGIRASDLSDVTIDLDGNPLICPFGPGNTARGVWFYKCSRMRIINGSIIGFYWGIDLQEERDSAGAPIYSDTTGQHRMQKLHLSSTTRAIRAEGRNLLIEDVQTSIVAGALNSERSIALAAVGQGSVVRRCVVRDTGPCGVVPRPSTNELVGLWLSDADQSEVTDNVIGNRVTHPSASWGVWISANSDGYRLRNNVVSGYAVGIAAFGSGSVVGPRPSCAVPYETIGSGVTFTETT